MIAVEKRRCARCRNAGRAHAYPPFGARRAARAAVGSAGAKARLAAVGGKAVAVAVAGLTGSNAAPASAAGRGPMRGRRTGDAAAVPGRGRRAPVREHVAGYVYRGHVERADIRPRVHSRDVRHGRVRRVVGARGVEALGHVHIGDGGCVGRWSILPRVQRRHVERRDVTSARFDIGHHVEAPAVGARAEPQDAARAAHLNARRPARARTRELRAGGAAGGRIARARGEGQGQSEEEREAHRPTVSPRPRVPPVRRLALRRGLAQASLHKPSP